MSKTLFEKIIAREIPATIIYEDDLVLAFRDIKPQAPMHVLMVPKKAIPRIAEAKPETPSLLGQKLQTPIPKLQGMIKPQTSTLVLGVSLWLGVWCLEFSSWSFPWAWVLELSLPSL